MRTTTFKDYLDFLISAEGRKDYFSCLADEKEELTAYYIAQNTYDREIYLMESNDYDVVIRLLNQYMITGDADTKEIMVEKMKSIAVEYFYKQIAEEFDREVDSRFIDKMHEHGLVRDIHKDNGEAKWMNR